MAGVGLQQVVVWSDGCAGQFKGTPAVLLHRQLALEMQLPLPLHWCYGASSHFKGRHDSEGGAVKHALAAAIIKEQRSSSDTPLMCSAEQLVHHAQQHLSKPARQQEPSAAHRGRAPVQQRTFFLLQQQQVDDVAAAYQPSQLEQQLLISKVGGIRRIHQQLFSSSKQEWHLQQRTLACLCPVCLYGGGAGDCEAGAVAVPSLQQLPLFKVPQREWQV